MLVAALDTTQRVGGLVLARDGEIVESRAIQSEIGPASVIYPALQEALAAHGWALADVDVFSAASGPGSFTGIRVGLTAVKALAEVLGKPVVPLTVLEALAFAGEGEKRAVVIDGRREEVFCAVFDAELDPVVAPAVRRWEAFRAAAEPYSPLWTATDEEVFSAGGVAPLPDAANRRIVPRPAEPLALLAAKRAAANQALRPEQVEAAYIRRSDAEVNWRGP